MAGSAPRRNGAWRLVTASLVALPVIGAAVAVAANPGPANRFRARFAAIAPQGTDVGPLRDLATVLADKQTSGGQQPESGVSFETRYFPARRMLVVTARSATPGVAQRALVPLSRMSGPLADRLAGRRGGTAVGDFERGLDGWSGASHFGRPPSGGGRVHGGRFGRWGLQTVCTTQPACGYSRPLTQRFAARRPVYASVWVRARRPRLVVLALGRGANDYKLSQAVRLGPQWKQVSVRWVPKVSGGGAELSAQRVGVGPVTYQLDGARYGSSPASVAEQSALFERPSLVVTEPARIAPLSASTARSGAIGAAAGLFVALVALLGARLAARRQQDADH